MEKKLEILMLLTAIFFKQFSSAQNLVPNWSFEDTVSCPTFVSQIDRALGWYSYRNTPDYFNSCNNNIMSVPSNLVGFQLARTGDAYAGFYSKTGIDYREWIGSQLSQVLIIGNWYHIKMYVSLAFNQSYNIGLATNNIGVRFSTVPYASINQLPLDGVVHLYSSSIISDTVAWVEIQGDFMADSLYQFIVIGNFFNDSATSTFSSDTNLTDSYYYIDDVSVVPIDTIVDGIHQKYDNTPILVYPNPSNEFIVVAGDKIISFIMVDQLGKKIYQSYGFNYSQVVNTENLLPGIYLIRIELPDNLIKQEKILIR